MVTSEEAVVEALEMPVEAAAVVVSFEGELDAADPAWDERITAAMKAGASQVVIDMLNVTFIDSSVVRELVLAYKRLHENGGTLRLVYTHHLIARVIEICGLTNVFPQYPTVEAALRRGRREV